MNKSSDRKRLALIINNITFEICQRDRKGAEKDGEGMKTLLEGLGYNVIMLNDLCSEVCLLIMYLILIHLTSY